MPISKAGAKSLTKGEGKEIGKEEGVPNRTINKERTMTGIELVAKERKRQIEEEGFSPKHDAEHTDGELAMAAACYAAPEQVYIHTQAEDVHHFVDPWPEDWHEWDKREEHSRIRQLAIAGALIAAEIDRLIATAKKPSEPA